MNTNNSFPLMKYMRVLHNYDAPLEGIPEDASFNATDVLKVHQGNVLLLYCAESSGWADGVSLNSMKRGWIPTNHCEPYEYRFTHQFFRTLTTVWTGISDHCFDWDGEARQYIEDLTAGVRHVMTEADCMRRGSPIIQAVPLLGFLRKTLFSRLTELLNYVEDVSRRAIQPNNIEAWTEHHNSYLHSIAEIAIKLTQFIDTWTAKTDLSSPWRTRSTLCLEADLDRPHQHPAERSPAERSPTSHKSFGQLESADKDKDGLLSASTSCKRHVSGEYKSWFKSSPESAQSDRGPKGLDADATAPSPLRQETIPDGEVVMAPLVKYNDADHWPYTSDLNVWRDSDSSFSSRSTGATTPELIQQVRTSRGKCLRVAVEGEKYDFPVPSEYGNVDELEFARNLVRDEDGTVIAGSPQELTLSLIYQPYGITKDYLLIFFTFYRRFMSPTRMASIIISQYKKPFALAGLTIDIRRRITHVLEQWLTKYWDSEKDTEVLDMLRDFVRDPSMTMPDRTRRRLVEAVNDEAYILGHEPVSPCTGLDYLPVFSGRASQASYACEASSALKPAKFLDISTISLAQQITVMTSNLFGLVNRFDLIRCVADKADKSNSIVRSMSTLTNDIANLVIQTIVTAEKASIRLEILTHWIMVGISLILMQNYESVMAVTSGINSTPVLRLQKTWSCLGEDMLAMFEKLKTVTSTTRNFGTLRQFLKEKAATGPSVPYVGLVLTDLTFAGLASSKFLEEKVNWRKFTQLHAVKEVINEMQRREYDLPVAQGVQEWLRGELSAMNSLQASHGAEGMAERMYQLSEAIEPRVNSQVEVLDDHASGSSGSRSLLGRVLSSPNVGQGSIGARKRHTLKRLLSKPDKRGAGS